MLDTLSTIAAQKWKALRSFAALQLPTKIEKLVEATELHVPVQIFNTLIL